MERRVELENIIIGTLLESDGQKNWYEDCRCSITADMFTDEVNRRIYSYISEMNAKGITDTRPSSIFDEYGEQVVDIVSRMCELCNEYSFIHKKIQYNELRYLTQIEYGVKVQYTDVKFTDYVYGFINQVFINEEERGDNRRGQDIAARHGHGAGGVGYAHAV